MNDIADLFPPTMPSVFAAQIVAADGTPFEYAETLESAAEKAAQWNAESDPRERVCADAYPFRAERLPAPVTIG